jgi:hypothetical protein
MADIEDRGKQSWDAATYEGLERAQLIDWMRLPLGRKLEWLEEAQERVERVLELRAKDGAESRDDG